MGPGDLEKIISSMPPEDAPELLTSIHIGEDAGVYLIGEDLALVQTLDFFPPIVDDPRTFGQVAAANALSDIYAMGARPITALNLVAFPCNLGLDVLASILEGGREKVREAGAVIIGGHTIEDDEPKYGLSLTGLVTPSEMLTIDGARAGDVLVLTKPIGTGILSTALKGGLIEEEDMKDAIESMCTLNYDASSVFMRLRTSACTDVTGFGLVGHLFEMVRASNVSAEIWADSIPFFHNALEKASMGMMPGGLYRNLEFVGDNASAGGGIDELMVKCLFDPQTSGGLLAAVDEGDLGKVLDELREGSCPLATAVGRILDGPAGRISIVSERSP